MCGVENTVSNWSYWNLKSWIGTRLRHASRESGAYKRRPQNPKFSLELVLWLERGPNSKIFGGPSSSWSALLELQGVTGVQRWQLSCSWSYRGSKMATSDFWWNFQVSKFSNSFAHNTWSGKARGEISTVLESPLSGLQLCWIHQHSIPFSRWTVSGRLSKFSANSENRNFETFNGPAPSIQKSASCPLACK